MTSDPAHDLTNDKEGFLASTCWSRAFLFFFTREVRMEWLTVKDCAILLNVCDDTIRKYHRKGFLPAVRTRGGMRLFTREDIEAFQAKRLESAQAAAQAAQEER